MPFQSRGPALSQAAVRSPATAFPILVADDDEALRHILHDLFEDEGYTVLEAADGEQVLEILRTSAQRFVVVLDHRMPHLSGEQVLYAVTKDRRLRRRHAFVFVSAAPHLSLQLTLMRVLTKFAIQRVDKPFEVDVLLDAVAQATRRLLRVAQRE
jgi:CheY-like chemotaxis protein